MLCLQKCQKASLWGKGLRIVNTIWTSDFEPIHWCTCNFIINIKISCGWKHCGSGLAGCIRSGSTLLSKGERKQCAYKNIKKLKFRVILKEKLTSHNRLTPLQHSSMKIRSVSVILLPAHPASFVHNFFSRMQSLYISKSQDAIVLQTCH